MQIHNQEYEQLKVLSKVILSEEDCREIISNYNQNLEQITQQSARDVYIRPVDLKDSIINANAAYYNFNINYDHADCFFAKYETGMHYQTLHMDCIAGEHQRKLSFSLLLNDNFSGGEIEFLVGGALAAKKGKLLVFPSFLPHKVTPVTKLSRYVIFGWFYGPNFI